MSRTIADDEAGIDNFAEPPHPADEPSLRRKPILIRMSDVEPEDIDWLWKGRLAVGKLSMLMGDPKVGKTWVTHYIAATLSTGRAWVDGDVPPVTNTVLITAEDDPADTIRPRLNALGADCNRIIFNPGFQVGKKECLINLADLDVIEEAVVDTNAGLVVVDPIGSYIPGVDSNRDNEIRQYLGPFGAMLKRRRAAGLVVAHMTKSNGSKAIHKAIGSVAFAGLARFVLAVAKDHDEDGEERRLFLSVGSNCTKEADTYSFSIDDGQLLWDPAPLDVDAEAVLAGPPKGKPREDDADHHSAAEELLTKLLANGPVPALEAIKAAEAAGIKKRTLQWTATKKLGIKPQKLGTCWVWELPKKAEVQ